MFTFILFSIIPSFFVFFAAGRLITRSINDWFNARIEIGLKNALLLHKNHTLAHRKWLKHIGTQLVDGISLCNIGVTTQLHNRIVNNISYYNDNDIIAYVCINSDNGLAKAVGKEVGIWRQFRKFNDRSTKSLRKDFFLMISTIEDEAIFDFYGSLYWVKKGPSCTIMLAKRYAPNIRYPLIEIQNAVTDYEQLKSMRNPICINYIFTFFLITILILFLSIWCTFYLARGITKPIQELLDAIAQIRRGSWNVQLSCKASNDFRTLVEGFNEMMHTIKQAQLQLEKKHEELFTILENIRAAVFLVNAYGRIIMCNAAAKKLALLTIHTESIMEKRINIFGHIITETFFEMLRNFQTNNKTQLSQEIVLPFDGTEHFFVTTISLVAINNLPKNFEHGALIVLEDVTQLVKANKLRTWQEAAKQMAHEIKNPLTPIQLATQRLQRRLKKTLGNDIVFLQSTNIILEQVALIKNLVTHFSEFATMPLLQRAPANLNHIVKEVACLYNLSYPTISINVDLFEKIPILLIDSKKITRVLVNLFDNSIRALQADKTGCLFRGEIKIITQKSNDGLWIELLFADNGPGIAQDIKDKLFLPYVSTEKKNMGLGLAIVRDIITLHGGSICLISSSKGAMFRIRFTIQ